MLKALLTALLSSGIKESSPARTPTPPPLKSGAIYHGNVTYVGPNWAKVTVQGMEAFIPAKELAHKKIESAAEVLTNGQHVELVILGPNERKPGHWQASLTAVREARLRASLSHLSSGQRLNGIVSDIKQNAILVHADGIDFYVPMAELAWEPVDYPANVVSLGQEVEFEIRRVTVPEWSMNWRANKCSAIASLRACIPKPEPRYIPMAFSALPFTIRARARRSANLDPVLMHILTELAAGHGQEEILARTRLPGAVLQAMFKYLDQEGLLASGALTRNACSLIEAHELAREINEANYGGLYAAAAEPGVRFATREGLCLNPPFPKDYIIPEYPANWPRPAFSPRADQEFLDLSGDAIPEEITSLLRDEQQRAVLAQHQADRRLHIMIAKDGPYRALCTYVADHWLYAGLWSAFDAIGPSKPYRPESAFGKVHSLLLVKLHALKGGTRLPQPVYLEPYTRTLWTERTAAAFRAKKLKETAFPDIPAPGPKGILLGEGMVAERFEPEAWYNIQFRSAH